MKSSVGRFVGGAAAIAVLVLLAAPAQATLNPSQFLAVTLNAAKDRINSALSSLFGQASTDVTPPTPSDVLRQVEGGAHSEFWDYLKDAGYDLREIETSVGIIPDIKITFQLVRELSDADRDWLQEELDADVMRRPGLAARVQRRIVQTLLDASEMQDLRVSKLVVGILPLPSADFVVEPNTAPLSEEHDAIYRAVLNRKGRQPGQSSSEER